MSERETVDPTLLAMWNDAEKERDAAARALVACDGAVSFVRRRVDQAYSLTEKDSVDAGTGVITRAPAPEPSP